MEGAGLTELLRYLRDPRLVARFQTVCGVRATLARSVPGVASQTERAPLDDDDDGAADTGGDGEGADRARRRRRAERDECNNGLVNGTALAAGETVTEPHGPKNSRSAGEPESRCNGSGWRGGAVKPLRRNSLTGDAGQEFLIQNKFFYYLFTLGTELGNELFYICFFPFLIWNVDPFVARRLIVVWVWVMYLGQCTKDVIRWPRPASPPVVKVEMFYNSEYSMPSTHAMSGTAIPLSLFLLTYGRWEYPFLLGFSLALGWCVLVCVSRIYMGMHSVLDVVAGFLYSLLILAVFAPALDVIDTFNLTFRHAPVLIVSLHAAMGLFSFTLDTWSTSRGDTAQILGTGAGIAVASHFNHQMALIPDPPASALPLTPPAPTLTLAGLCLLRFALGVLTLLVTRAVMKAFTIPLVCWTFGIPSGDVRKARQHMQVELPYRYIVYWTVGFSAFFLVPLLFRYIGLS
ncbi:sphingosine-1-phosphate phosphatase 1 [Brachyhypopomus gauderio]|uniref:sphingosine-1-phosphate phosphatase 1 n=1 Tax=Brachyhypopomus gauderio TaxID=698409 RepID=UPI0040421F53